MSAAATHRVVRAAPSARLLAVVAVAAAAGATLGASRAHPAGGFAGRSALGGTIELSAAIALAVAGVLAWAAGSRSAVAIAAAGVLWLLMEWSNPDTGNALLFTAGLIGAFAPVPVIVHVALSRPPSRARRPAVLGSLAGLAALGFAPALVFDVQAQGCLACPHNLLLVHGDAALYLDLSRWGIRIAIATTTLAAVAIVVAAARGSRVALIATGPVRATAVMYLAFVVADLWHGAPRAVLSNDAVDVALWRAQGVALVLFALALIRGTLRVGRTRTAMAALVVDVGNAPQLGGARAKLAEALADPHVELAYRRESGQGYVDIEGAPVTPTEGPAAMPVVRDGHEIAMVVHDPRLLADRERVDEAIAAARLAIENEQLQAELNAQAAEIRASRARIVHDGDHARRALERDLHDGAQQRLVSLSLAIRLLHGRARTAATRAALDRADARLREALAELRDIAHGIYPAALAEEGLHAALEDLAERADGTIRVMTLPHRRFPATVEEAAYFAVAELIEDLHDDATIAVQARDERLDVTVDREGQVPRLQDRITEIRDRVGALDGDVDVVGTPDGIGLRASIPCE